jgi:hypothetical protein
LAPGKSVLSRDTGAPAEATEIPAISAAVESVTRPSFFMAISKRTTAPPSERGMLDAVSEKLSFRLAKGRAAR